MPLMSIHMSHARAFTLIWLPTWPHFEVLQNSPKVDKTVYLHAKLGTWVWKKTQWFSFINVFKILSTNRQFTKQRILLKTALQICKKHYCFCQVWLNILSVIETIESAYAHFSGGFADSKACIALKQNNETWKNIQGIIFTTYKFSELSLSSTIQKVPKGPRYPKGT